MTDDIVARLRSLVIFDEVCSDNPLGREAADRIEQLEKGFRDILALDDPMLMKMIAKACLTGAIDDQGKYCFVPPFALGEKNK
jgi:hypothetical protein